MPARIVVVLNDPELADATVSALTADGYDALAVHDSMAALTLLEQAEDIELLVASTYFGPQKPTGAALALMTRISRPGLKAIFTGNPELAALLEDIGHVISGPVSPSKMVNTARLALSG
jgi:hypothetical protein